MSKDLLLKIAYASGVIAAIPALILCLIGLYSIFATIATYGVEPIFEEMSLIFLFGLLLAIPGFAGLVMLLFNKRAKKAVKINRNLVSMGFVSITLILIDSIFISKLITIDGSITVILFALSAWAVLTGLLGFKRLTEQLNDFGNPISQ